MKTKTEEQLNEYIESLKVQLEAAEDRANNAEEKFENLQEQMADGRDTWAQPLDWEAKDLPLPRLEMYWSRDNDYDTRCLYVLVYRHLLDGCSGKPHITARPMGLTNSRGGSRAANNFMYDDGEIDMPFRDGAHARHDAVHLGLPLFVTTEDGDMDQVVFGGDGKDRNRYTQVKYRRVKR